MNEESTPAPDHKVGPPWDAILEYLGKNGGLDEIRVDIKTKAGPSASLTFPRFEDVCKSFNDLIRSLPSEDEVKPSASKRVTRGASVDRVDQYTADKKDVPFIKEERIHTSDSQFARHPVSVSASPQEHNKKKTDFHAIHREGLRNTGLGSISEFKGLPVKVTEQQQQQSTPTTNTDFHAMYHDDLAKNLVSEGLAHHAGLSKLIQAAGLGNHAPVDLSTPSEKQPSTRKSDKKKKMRKFVPNEKEYVDDCRDEDVLFGRGGRSNHHPGNKMYRELVMSKQEYYRSCDKNMKTEVAQSIVDAVRTKQLGRFLEKDADTNRYYVVPSLTARRKVGQALRENNTEEARAAKREKYGKKSRDGNSSQVSSHHSSTEVGV